jgi:hypothetical protein
MRRQREGSLVQLGGAVLAALIISLVVTTSATAAACPNEHLRTGPSAKLPDCRAYELVTPPDTNGSNPTAPLSSSETMGMATWAAAPDGGSVLFGVFGPLSGEANGSANVYEAIRTPNGWTTRLASPKGTESLFPAFGGASSDHHAFWRSGAPQLDPGSLVLDPDGATYIRSPEGSYQLVGEGSTGVDPNPNVHWMTAGLGHVVFSSKVQLEPDAAPLGPGGSFFLTPNTSAHPSAAIYDRTPAGLEVVSLLPGGMMPPAGTTTYYRGVSADGSAVFFNVDGTLYVRLDNATTLPLATVTEPSKVVFQGSSRDGSTSFYSTGGGESLESLFEFDADSQTSQLIATGGVEVWNVAADGSHVYFESDAALTGAEQNEYGEQAQAGSPNLYVWDGDAVGFIANAAVFSGEFGSREWRRAVFYTTFGSIPTRTNPSGSSFLFETKDSPSGYDNNGFSQVYLYDNSAESLRCISCNPRHSSAVSNAKVGGQEFDITAPDNPYTLIANLTDDGRTAFFQTGDALLPGDAGGKQDVYEWQAPGAGDCTAPAGCVSLISSGHSSGDSWLFGATPDGHDVFFTTNDTLLPQKQGGAAAIYDARIGGGFPSATSSSLPCVGEACQGPAPLTPAPPAIGSALTHGPANPTARRRKVRQKRKRRAKQRNQRSVNKGNRANDGRRAGK